MSVSSGLYLYDVVVKRSHSLSHLPMSSCIPIRLAINKGNKLLTEHSSGDFCFTRESIDWRICLRGGRTTHLLHFEAVLAVQLGVLDSTDLVDGNAAVTQADRVVSGADKLCLERVDDQALDVVVDRSGRVQLHLHCGICAQRRIVTIPQQGVFWDVQSSNSLEIK